MKTRLAILISFIILIIPLTVSAEVSLWVQDEEIDLAHPPVIVEDRALIPLRETFELLHAEVEWLDSERVIVASKKNILILLKIDNRKLIRTDVESGETTVLTMDVPPQLINDLSYVPLRVVAESFSVQLLWDGEAKAIHIIEE